MNFACKFTKKSTLLLCSTVSKLPQATNILYSTCLLTVTQLLQHVSSYTLGGGQNGLSVLLQSLQHAYTKQTLQTSTNLLHARRQSKRIFSTSTGLATVTSNFLVVNLLHAWRRFSPNFYKVLKTNSSSFTSHPSVW